MPPDTPRPTCPHGRNAGMCTDCQDRIRPRKVPIPRQPRALPSRSSAKEPSSTKVQAKRGPAQQGHAEGDDSSMPPAKRRNRRQNKNGETVKNIKKEVWEYIDFTLSTLEKAKIELPYTVQVDDQVLEHKKVDRGRRNFGLIGMERFRDRCSRPLNCVIRFYKEDVWSGDLIELGCEHYRRNVKVECSNCFKWYSCEYCHDSGPPHFREFEHCLRFEPTEVENMRCMLCDEEQPPSDTCTRCRIHSAYYYCSTCKFWDDDGTKSIYHCRDCGSCLLGQGLGMDAAYNNSCLVCYPRSAVETIGEEHSERRLEAAMTPRPSISSSDSAFIDWSQTAGSHTIPSHREQVNTGSIVNASPAYSYGYPKGSAQSFRLPFFKSTSVSDDAMESLSQSVAGMNMGVRSWK